MKIRGYDLDEVDDFLDEIVTSLGFREYTTGSKSTLDMFCITMALMVGTAGLPHVIIRFFTVPKVRDARISAGWALAFIAILYTTAPSVAAMARLNLMATIEPAPGQYMNYEQRPQWIRNWERTGLLGFEDKNGDGRIQYYNDASPDFATTAAGYGWNGNELSVDRDIMVLANPEIAKLPNWVIALVAAGGLAAALSTSSLFLSLAGNIMSRDLPGSLGISISPVRQVLVSRIAMSVMGVAAIGFAALSGDMVAILGTYGFGTLAAATFPIFVIGLLWKSASSQGVSSGVSGTVSGPNSGNALSAVWPPLLRPVLTHGPG